MNQSFKALAFLALSLVGCAQAQSLSAGCTSSIITLTSNQDISQCLSLQAFITDYAGLEQTDSIVPAVNNFQQSFCAAPACDNQTITNAMQTVINACQTDLGIDSTTSAGLVAKSPEILAGVKKALCLEDATNTTSTDSSTCGTSANYCDIKLLGDLETALGKNISISGITALLSGDSTTTTDVTTALTKLTNDQICTSCNQALYQTLNSTLSSTVGSSLDAIQLLGQSPPVLIDAKCGANFLETPFSATNVTVACANSTSTASARLRYARWA